MHYLRVMLPEDMHKAVKEAAEAEGVPMASFIRQAVAEMLLRRGVEVESDVQWGGRRLGKGKCS